MKRLVVILLVLGFVLVGCQAGAEEADPAEEATEEPSPTATITPTDEPTATHTQPYTRTPLPSRTPTATLTVTATVTATATATDIPATQAPAASNTPGGSAPTATATTQAAAATPTPIIAATDEPTAEATATTEEVVEYLPEGQSVWQLDTVPYEYFSTEACSEPIYHDFYGLVAVESVEGGMNWIRQDGFSYYLGRTAPNTYWGSGGSIFEGLTLQISVYLSGPEAMGVTYTLADNNNPDCKHVFRYGAFRAW